MSGPATDASASLREAGCKLPQGGAPNEMSVHLWKHLVRLDLSVDDINMAECVVGNHQ
jgi:hypothetical protein